MEDDAEDTGSCGCKDAGSSIVIFWKSSSRDMRIIFEASVQASSINSDASSNDASA